MNKILLTCLSFSILSGCSDIDNFYNLFNNRVQDSEEWKNVNIIKVFNQRVNLVKKDSGDLSFGYLKYAECGGGIGYYDVAYNMTLDKEFYSSVEKISELVDVDSLKLELFESNNGIATIVGLEDNKNYYTISISESRFSCDDDMYFTSKDDVKSFDF